MLKIYRFIVTVLCFVFIQQGAAEQLVQSNCENGICKYQLHIEQEGFYVFSDSVDSLQESGLWDFSIEADDGPQNVNNIYFGGLVTDDELGNSFISFYLEESKSLSIQLSDFLGRTTQFKINIYQQYDSYEGRGMKDIVSGAGMHNAGYRLPIHSIEVNGNELIALPQLGKGHYFMTLNSLDSSLSSAVGVHMSGLGSVLKITAGGKLGNSATDSSDRNYIGYFAQHLDAGDYVVKLRYAGMKEFKRFDKFYPGSGKPNITVKRAVGEGLREQLFSNDLVYTIQPDDQLDVHYNNLAMSGNGLQFAYSMQRNDSSAVKVMMFDAVSGVSTVVDSIGPKAGFTYDVSALSLSADGTKLAYSVYSGDYRYEELMEIFITEELRMYNVASTEFRSFFHYTDCSPQCLGIGNIENVSFEKNDRYLLFDDPTDYLTIIDTTGALPNKLVEGLGFFNTNDLALGSEAAFILFSSDDQSLVENDTNPLSDIFIWNNQDSSIQLISVLQGGEQIQGANLNPVLSYDENMILFTTNAGPRVSLYAYDRTLGYARKLTDVGSNSSYALDGVGGSVIFSSSLDFSLPDFGGRSRIWTIDLASGRKSLKIDSKSTYLSLPQISGDGSVISFVSQRLNTNTGLLETESLHVLEHHNAVKTVQIE